MIKRQRSLRFKDELPKTVVDRDRAENLERDRPLDFGIARTANVAHAAKANVPADFVLPDPAAGLHKLETRLDTFFAWFRVPEASV